MHLPPFLTQSDNTMRLLYGSGALLLLAASTVSADTVIEPWNRMLRDYVVANRIGSSVSTAQVPAPDRWSHGWGSGSL